MKKQLVFLKIDYNLQNLLIVINTILLCVPMYGWFFLLYWQILVGFYQFGLSAWVNIIWLKNRNHLAETRFLKRRFIHLFISSILLSGWYLIAYEYIYLQFPGNTGFFVGVFALLVVPQILTYYYYFTTGLHYHALKNYLTAV